MGFNSGFKGLSRTLKNEDMKMRWLKSYIILRRVGKVEKSDC